MRSIAALVSSLLVFSGCAAAIPQLTEEGATVRARKADPPESAEEIGPVEVSHGDGCGLFGVRGTYEGAMTELKNRAADMGADYVSIMTVDPPHSEQGCYVQTFVIRGVAYKLRARRAPRPTED